MEDNPFDDIKIYGSKTLSGLFSDIAKAHGKRAAQIDACVAIVLDGLKDAGKTTESIIEMVPIARNLFDTAVKNDGALTTLAGIVNKMSSSSSSSSDPSDSKNELSEAEQEELKKLAQEWANSGINP